MLNNKICIIGLGYVGFPLASLTAIKEFDVVGFDINKSIIEKINSGQSHIRDLEVEALFYEALETNRFIATSEISDASDCTHFIICVPTPVDENNDPDLLPLYTSIDMIASLIKKNDLVVIESTVFPGTCEDEIIPRLNSLTNMNEGDDYYLAHCPERVNPGDDFWTSRNIPRVVGSNSTIGLNKASEFYNSIMGGGIYDVRDIKQYNTPKFSLDSNGDLKISTIPLGSITKMHSIRDAEAVKAMENTVRDVNIAFVNELAKISDVLNLDVLDVIDGMSTKPFGKGPFYPGIGVGGHCIAVDPEWLRMASQKAGYIPEMIQLSRATNNEMPKYAIDLLQSLLNEVKLPIKGTNVLILGVAYKRDVDDNRESPFYKVRQLLNSKGAKLDIYDSWFQTENTIENLKDGLNKAQAIVVITDHSDIVKELQMTNFSQLPVKVIIDGRNCLKKEDMVNQGVLYSGIGR